MGNNNTRLADSSLKIEFEGESRAFDGNHPIVGAIKINVAKNLPAYCLIIKLQLIDMCKKVDRGDKGQHYNHEKKLRAYEKIVTVANFENNILPFGESSYPFSLEVPHDAPQSSHYYHSGYEFFARLKWYVKAQVVPVDVSLLNDEWGKSHLRDRQRILISPTRPLVHDPQFDLDLRMDKKVGLIGRQEARMDVKIAKSFFLAGEMAYMQVEIDNSACTADCTLIISQNMKIKQYQASRRCSETSSERTESFVGPAAGQKTSFFVAFQVAGKRRKPCSLSSIKNSQYYGNLSQQLPESGNRNTYFVAHYFELYLSHKGTLFSNDAKKRFYFQLIQPSLVDGVTETPPPIFVDKGGQPLTFDAPVQPPPAQEAILQGTVMDEGEEAKLQEEKSKAKEEGKEKEKE